MGKFIGNDVYDAGLDFVGSNLTRIDLCTQAPADWDEVQAYSVGHADVNAGAASGAIDSTVSGRRIIIGYPIPVTVLTSAPGTVTHIAITTEWTATPLLLAVNECGSNAMGAGTAVTIQPFDIELRDPA